MRGQTLRARSRILIVLDDGAEISRERLASVLATRFPELDVIATADGEDAMRVVSEPRLSLLITVEEAPRIDGLVLAAWGRRQDPELPVVLLSEERSALGRTGVERLPRSTPLLRLVEHAARLIDPPASFTGELTLPSFLELVRVLTTTHASGALSVRRRGESGTVWLELGNVVHAVVEGYFGVEAFHRMLRWKGGKFSFAAGEPPTRSIVMPAEQLMRECARFLDRERMLARGSSPGLASLAARHFRRAMALIENGRHADALEELYRAAHLDLENKSYRDHLERLREHLGLTRR